MKPSFSRTAWAGFVVTNFTNASAVAEFDVAFSDAIGYTAMTFTLSGIFTELTGLPTVFASLT